MTLWAHVREFFTTPMVGIRQTFDSPPRPIDAVIGEMLGITAGSVPPKVGRAEALSVPAVLKGRNMICSIATLPLVQRGPDRRAVDNNPLFRQLDRDVPNVVTLAQTIEDLLFEAIAWWQITGFGWDGFPSDIRHLDPLTVSIDPPKGRSPTPLPSGIDPHEPIVWVNGKPVSAATVIRFDSPNPPLLKAGARAIKRAVLLDQAARMYAEDPRPLDFFTPADGADPVDDDAVSDILSKWRSSRKRRSTAYVPAALKHNTVDSPNPRDLQLVELQKQAVLDIANALGVDPEDLGQSTTSRTYQNATDRRQDRINEVLSPYMRAVTDRLSMGDVTPRGHTVAFSLDDYMKADPATRWDVYQAEHALFGDSVLDEIRAREGQPALAPPRPSAGKPGEEAIMPEQMPVQSARESVHNFAKQEHMTLDVPVNGFSVDVGKRTVEGIIMLYGAVGNKNGMRFRFSKGALKWSNAGRVKLNLLHDSAQTVGYATVLREVGTSLHARFKIGRGPEGDRALQLAEDKIMDGFSVGVDWESEDVAEDPNDKTGMTLLVKRADLRHVALTPEPVFDDARVTKVAASRNHERNTMPENEEITEVEAESSAPAGLTLTQDQAVLLLTRPGAMDALAKAAKPTAKPVTEGLTFSADQIDALIKSGALGTLFGLPATTTTNTSGPTKVDPTRRTASTTVMEAEPYRFSRRGDLLPGSHDFSTDMFASLRDPSRNQAASDRVMTFMREHFDVITTNVAGVNPNIQRPDLYVDQREFRYPIWESVNKGTLTEVTPFVFPKFSSSGTLVGAHTQGTEPSSGTFVVTTQTVTPTALSGKAKVSREVFDAGGNPQVSGLIWTQMQRGWYEALEAAIVAELDAASPTSLGAFTIGGGTNKQTLVSELEMYLSALQYVRGGFSMTDLYAQIDLYQALVSAKDTSLRPYFASIGPMNARGSTESRFGALDINGVAAYPAWALAATGSVIASSYLFDRASVHGWASPPQRIDINSTEVANVYIGVWGYKATAISDINGVREVLYDPA
jgi:phage head maturation protease